MTIPECKLSTSSALPQSLLTISTRDCLRASCLVSGGLVEMAGTTSSKLVLAFEHTRISQDPQTISVSGQGDAHICEPLEEPSGVCRNRHVPHDIIILPTLERVHCNHSNTLELWITSKGLDPQRSLFRIWRDNGDLPLVHTWVLFCERQQDIPK